MTGTGVGVLAAMTREIDIPAARGLPDSAVILLTLIAMTATFTAVYLWRLHHWTRRDCAACGEAVTFSRLRRVIAVTTARWV